MKFAVICQIPRGMALFLSDSGQTLFAQIQVMRCREIIKITLTFAFMAFAGYAFAASPYVIDGDTLAINGERIRLIGIDAPELSQSCVERKTGKIIACGQAARDFVVRLITGAHFFCDPPAIRDKYDRLVTRCYANGRDIAQELVEAGWAVTPIGWPSDYRDSEHRAKAFGRGLWRMKFDHPQQHRRRVE